MQGSHKHDYQYFSGKDMTQRFQKPLERYCIQCGEIEIYSGLAKKWVKVGNMNDILLEEKNPERFLDPYDH